MKIILKSKLILICFLAISSYAIGQNSLLKTANHYFESMSYIKAIDSYEQLLKKSKLNEAESKTVKTNLAECYIKIKDNENAERVLAELVGSTEIAPEDANIVLKYAQSLASNGKYAEAQKAYSNYNTLVASDPRGKSFSKLYSDINVLSKNAACYKVDYLSINTNASEFSPSNYQNGLIFVSNRRNTSGVRRVFTWNNTPFLDLYYLEDVAYLNSTEASLGGSGTNDKKGKSKNYGEVGSDEYTSPTANDNKTIGSYGGKNISSGFGYADKPLTESDRMEGSINSKFHEGPAAFFKDGTKVIFTRNNMKNSKKATKSSDGIIKLKMYLAEKKGDKWDDGEELPFCSDEFSTGHPALSADEKYLFFASDMPGGFGGTDIYVSNLEGGNWSAPINLGKEINSAGNEMFPFMDDKGGLYFSSDGHAGMGELDIFYTAMNGIKQKGKISNIGVPLNSSKDDFGIITDGLRKTGYFSSNRKRGGNDDDIYKFERDCELKGECELILMVYDAETKLPITNAKINYKDREGNNIEVETDSLGNVQLTTLETDFDYIFKAQKEEYTPSTISYTTNECDGETSRLEIPLSKLNNNASDSTGNNLTNQQNTTTNNGNQKTCIIKGKVKSQSKKELLEGVEVILKSSCDGSEIRTKSDAEGNFEFTAVEGCDYTIEGKKEKMGSQAKTIAKLNCKDNTNDGKNDINMFTTGDIVSLDNIYFDYGKCNLRKDAKAELDKVVKIMRDYPSMRIEMRAHTDSRSSSEFNQKISEGRAKAAAEYLFKRGISRTRVEYKGYGETMPVNKCVDGVECTEEEHAQNRRVEFKILQMQ